MNKIGLAIAAVLGLAVLTPSTAEAGGCRTRVTYDSCGYRLNWEYRFVGYNCHGCPVYQWVVVSRCAPPSHCDRGYSYGGHQHGGYYNNFPRYTYPGGSCYPGHGRSGISFHFSR